MMKALTVDAIGELSEIATSRGKLALGLEPFALSVSPPNFGLTTALVEQGHVTTMQQFRHQLACLEAIKSKRFDPFTERRLELTLLRCRAAISLRDDLA